MVSCGDNSYNYDPTKLLQRSKATRNWWADICFPRTGEGTVDNSWSMEKSIGRELVPQMILLVEQLLPFSPPML